MPSEMCVCVIAQIIAGKSSAKTLNFIRKILKVAGNVMTILNEFVCGDKFFLLNFGFSEQIFYAY